MSNLTKRILTGAIGIPLMILIIMSGRIAFGAALIVAIALGSKESLELIGKIDKAPIFKVLSLAYVALPLLCLGLLYMVEFGPTWVIFTLIATWLADTSAYTVGRLIGRTPLAPTISPNKTIEGAVGGLAVTALAFAALRIMPVLSISDRVIFGLVLAAAAAVGDLFESWLKRRAGIKDSGDILPGHGGFLDRIDSLLFTAPLSYLLLSLWV